MNALLIGEIDMIQDELLEIIRQYLGIELRELRKRATISSAAVSAQIRGLERRGLIIRKTIRTLKTWSFFPIESDNQGIK